MTYFRFIIGIIGCLILSYGGIVLYFMLVPPETFTTQGVVISITSIAVGLALVVWSLSIRGRN